MASYTNMFSLYNKPTDSLICGELEEKNDQVIFCTSRTERGHLTTSTDNLPSNRSKGVKDR